MPAEKKLSFYLDMCSFAFDPDPLLQHQDSSPPVAFQPGTPPAINEKRVIETEEMATPEYLEVEVNAERTFIVHKAPLLSRCGRLVEAVEEVRKKSQDSPEKNSSKLLRVQVKDIPGGSEAFEMVVRFCYSKDADIATTIIMSANVAMLRCAAEFLEMTETVCKGNLMRKTEEYLRAMVFCSWEEALVVLRSCEKLQLAAEKTQVLQRCVSSLADKASCSFSFAAEMNNSPIHAGIESYFASYLVSTPSVCGGGTFSSSHRSSRAASENWWFDDLSTLSVHLVARVVKAMTTNRASDHRVLAKFLLHYLRSALPTKRVQREIVEVVVGLLASLERSSVSCRSLLGLRRIAIAVRAGKPYRREIESMIGAQLDKATLDNILIPALPLSRSSSLYDVDLVLRLVDFFLKDKAEAIMVAPTAAAAGRTTNTSDTSSSSALTKVGDLMDKYLIEIAADTHLRPSRFLALVESLPDYARECDDGLYRAVDIYLEAHPSISEADASRLFKVINYHKLGSETCKAAALNSRFPPSFVIQVALVQQSQQQQLRASTEGSFRSGRDTDRSSSPPPKGSPRVGQQTVVHVQCAHFEFTLRQIQQDKKKTDTTTTSSRTAAAYRTELSNLQNVKKTQSRRESFDSADSSRKRSRVEMISGFHRLKQLFHSKSRQH
ncbi:unnamed protein product [Sphagnum balticum]